MISLIINDKKIEVEEGFTVLKAAEQAGIKIPTLCAHKALSPYGACRLCLVEVSRSGRSSEIHTSCTYPAMEGLVVQTNSERVIKTRKIIIELLLARCPDSEVIKNLARELGVEKVRIKYKNKDCILCGLCVRMCEERMESAAISFSGRGPRREVTSPFGKPSEICQVCGACDFVCPTGKVNLAEVSKIKPRPIPFEHNMGLNSRPAVYIPYPQAIPNKATIDDRYCVHMLSDKCEVCKEFCEAGAINYEQKEEKLDLNVGSVIFSPGYDLFNAGAKLEYGYLNYSNVITAIEFERILSASGPYEGKVLRPSDNLTPKKIAFIQCVGSRDTERDYCSSICCMYATKEAIIAKEHAGEELECHIY
ncbi:MAG: 2Fe-2S iron-sulfur cluster binding domain-containing protein, partial [Actinobacteria bacterium]|nr:2Fe-2S iron-sulfur cluster binding domain-containing protein [Actinomycetota bacterium]